MVSFSTRAGAVGALLEQRVQRPRIGHQLLVALPRRLQARVDLGGQQTLDLAVADSAVPVARLDALNRVGRRRTRAAA